MKLELDQRLFTVCAVFIEQHLIKLDREDMIDAVYERLNEGHSILKREGVELSHTSRESIIEVADEVLENGINQKLLEKVDDYYLLTDLGREVGQYWVQLVQRIKDR
jgi:hypothetical protein